ncbi:MAG: methyltransferase [Microcystis sp. LE17-20D]|nr:methyltransferase [Microcystis sp. LE17-20D]MCZ8064870.1 methyltransferase [Microcystis sp. LE17-20D]MCZ8162174.1 methyltransferase [Microcystis sp. LE19-196.1B]MCZ8272969.1 methyltransferase [Microcystis sp. LE19-4.1E]
MIQQRPILEQYPHLKVILFDEEYVISHCQPTLEKHGILHRCQPVGGNFFESVPSGGDGYLLKHIIHDWDDRRAIAILKNCCQALDSDGKVLVLEMVVPSGNNPSAAKMLDLNMLVMCPGGKERTAEEFEELLSQAGLKLNRIIPTQEDICIIECVKK